MFCSETTTTTKKKSFCVSLCAAKIHSFIYLFSQMVGILNDIPSSVSINSHFSWFFPYEHEKSDPKKVLKSNFTWFRERKDNASMYLNDLDIQFFWCAVKAIFGHCSRGWYNNVIVTFTSYVRVKCDILLLFLLVFVPNNRKFLT